MRRFPGALCALALLCLAPAPGEAERWYVVREGDTLTRIAVRHGVTVEAIANLNGLNSRDVIRIDQRLKLPDAGPVPGTRSTGDPAPPEVPPPAPKAPSQEAIDSEIHVVRQGDTLYALGRRYGVKVPELMAWNGIGPKDVLRVGQRLVVRQAIKVAIPEPVKAAPEPQPQPGGQLAQKSAPETERKPAPAPASPEPQKPAPVEPQPDAEPKTAASPPTPKMGEDRETDLPEERKPVSVSSKPETSRRRIPFFSRRGSESASVYLRECKETIDKPKIKRDRWKYVVIHHSGTSKGSADVFEHYHRMVRGMENGLAYHFVIGNGSYTGDGLIEVGDRWRKQKAGGHLYSEFLNDISIGICFVGDFNSERPTARQIAACIELVDYLRKICPGTRPKFMLHREINPRPTECPGKYFPGDALRKRLK